MKVYTYPPVLHTKGMRGALLGNSTFPGLKRADGAYMRTQKRTVSVTIHNVRITGNYPV